MESKTMKIRNKKNVTYLDFNIYSRYDSLIAVHSTRIGGISEGIFKSMNLGFSRNDRKEDVLENYKIFSEVIGIFHERMVLSDQWHHTNILKVDERHLGMGIVKKREYNDVDGLITNIKDIPLVTFYADCVPVYFYDPIKEVIGMAHSGWKGTVLGIAEVMLNMFKNDYESNVNDIVVAIGPAICKSCYEVGKEVVDGLRDLPFDISDFYEYDSTKDKYHIDLWEINKKMLLELGVLNEHISVSDLCTKCNPELFFSHRGHGNERGTQIGVMMLKS